MNYLKGLNDRQQEAVLHGEGPLLILAGAGSGKTRVLTHRVAYLIEERGIFPGNILAITFTNKAASEMKERVTDLLDGDIDGIWMGTFHSVCVRILRRNIDRIGYERGFSIYDRDDQITLMKECIEELNIDEKKYRERSILAIISRLKDDMTSPKEYIDGSCGNPYEEKVGKLYELYGKKLKQNNALDFDDLIIKTVELLRTDPHVLNYYQKKFKYIFVDEFQDTNKAQYQLISLLAQEYKNLCVVGDDDQSIYGWRGADISNILNFEKEFTDTRIIKLEQNYRSTQNILDVANHLIRNNYGRKDKELWTDNSEGHQVTMKCLLDSYGEAQFVADKIEEHIRKGYNPSDFAILYRTNAQSRSFEETFMRRSIPYKLVGGLRFYDRKEVKDIIAYLKVIQNPVDNISLRRIINMPRRGIGKVTMEKLEMYANHTGGSIYSSLLDIKDIDGLSNKVKKSLEEFRDMINRFMAMGETMDIQDFIEKLVYEVGYIKYLEDGDNIESRTRLENIKEFISVAMDFQTLNPEGSLEDFLANVSLLSDVDKTADVDNSVTLLTVHSAKGLEFPIVFMVGMEDGLFPIVRALDDETELEEERRLCYVAITRAEELLYISFVRDRTIYGKRNLARPSRFIGEMPKELVNMEEGWKEARNWPSGNRGVESAREELIRVQNYPKVDLGINIGNAQVKEGVKVKHKKWGIGTIVQLNDRNDDKEMLIAFDGIGVKRLLLSISPIEIVKGE